MFQSVILSFCSELACYNANTDARYASSSLLLSVVQVWLLLWQVICQLPLKIHSSLEALFPFIYLLQI